MSAGVCRMCGCSEFDACAGGCAWFDRARTVCTECASAALAELREIRAYKEAPGLALAFHRGFVVGWFDVRRIIAMRHGKNKRRYGTQPEANPYLAPAFSRAWLRGLEAGRVGGRAFERAHGPITNTPRPFVYRRAA